MLVSSSIVGLALIGQVSVTRFDGRFTTFALVLLGALVVIGTLAQMRVGNASIEDLLSPRTRVGPGGGWRSGAVVGTWGRQTCRGSQTTLRAIEVVNFRIQLQ